MGESSRTSDDKMQEHRIGLSCCEAQLGVAEISMRRGSPALTWPEEWRLDFLSTGGGSLFQAFSPAIFAMQGRHTSRLCIYSKFLSLLENAGLLLPTHSHGKKKKKRAHSPGLSPFLLSLEFFSMLVCFLFFLRVFFCLPFPQACFASHKTWFAGTLWQQAGEFKLNSSGWGRHPTYHQIGQHTHIQIL